MSRVQIPSGPFLKMTIKFCLKCGSMIVPRTVKGETLLLCNSCGDFKIVKGKVELKTKDKIISKSKIAKGVVKDGNIFATYNNVCKKCGYDKAQIIDIGAFYSDEDHITFLKCGKCGFSERVGKVS